MSLLVWILLFSLLGSVLSLAGGVLLIYNEELCKRLGMGMVSFAAGVLLAVAFTDLLPESIALRSTQGKIETAVQHILLVALGGMIFFFFTKRFVVWFHGHHHRQEQKTSATPLLITLGDSLHNFVDGVAIAAGFFAGIPTGIITALSVALHEVPQEIGDFTVMLQKGMGKDMVFKLNLSAAFTAILGAGLGYYFLNQLQTYIPYVLAFAAGNFIYIATADLIPEIHHHENESRHGAYVQSLLLLAGVVLIFIINRFTHG